MSLPALIGQIVAVVLVSFFHAMLARLFVRLFVKATVPFATAYLFVLLSNMAQFTLIFVTTYAMAKTGVSLTLAPLLMFIAFLIGGTILGFLPKGPNGETIGAGYGFLVQICSMLLVIVPIAIAIWLIRH